MNGPASSQGDSAFAVYSLDDLSFAGRFYIATGNGFDAVTETDGIELSLSALGSDYPGGLLIVQDGHTPAGRQNFKLIDWRQVRDALNLD
jgi:3-phytase